MSTKHSAFQDPTDSSFGPIRPARRAAIAATGAINKQYLHPYRDPEWLHYPQTAGKYERVDHGFATRGIAAPASRAKKTATTKSNQGRGNKVKNITPWRDEINKKTEDAAGSKARPGPSTSTGSPNRSLPKQLYPARYAPSLDESAVEHADTDTGITLPSPPPPSSLFPSNDAPNLAANAALVSSYNALYAAVPSTSSERRFWQSPPTINSRGPPLFAPLSPSLANLVSAFDDNHAVGIAGPAGMEISAPANHDSFNSAFARPSAGPGSAPGADRMLYDPPATTLSAASTVGRPAVDKALRSEAAVIAQTMPPGSTAAHDGMTGRNVPYAAGDEASDRLRNELKAIQQGILGVMADLASLTERAKTLTAALKQDGDGYE